MRAHVRARVCVLKFFFFSEGVIFHFDSTVGWCLFSLMFICIQNFIFDGFATKHMKKQTKQN